MDIRECRGVRQFRLRFQVRAGDDYTGPVLVRVLKPESLLLGPELFFTFPSCDAKGTLVREATLSPEGVLEEDEGDKREPREYDKEIEGCAPGYELRNDAAYQWSYGGTQKGGSIIDANHGATFTRVVDILRGGVGGGGGRLGNGQSQRRLTARVAAPIADTAPPCDFPPALALTGVCHMHNAYPR